jgi:hypothetical protein
MRNIGRVWGSPFLFKIVDCGGGKARYYGANATGNLAGRGPSFQHGRTDCHSGATPEARLNGDDKVLAQAIALRIVQTLRVKALRGGPLDGTERRKGVCIWRLGERWRLESEALDTDLLTISRNLS